MTKEAKAAALRVLKQAESMDGPAVEAEPAIKVEVLDMKELPYFGWQGVIRQLKDLPAGKLLVVAGEDPDRMRSGLASAAKVLNVQIRTRTDGDKLWVWRKSDEKAL